MLLVLLVLPVLPVLRQVPLVLRQVPVLGLGLPLSEAQLASVLPPSCTPLLKKTDLQPKAAKAPVRASSS